MKLSKYILTAAVALIGTAGLAQNQLHLSQYMLHQPLLNPAAMGSYNNLNGALLYKHQWTGFDGAPKIQGFNINTPLGGGNNYLGLTVYNDQIGVNHRMDISASYAYRGQIDDESAIVFGMSATMALMQSNLAEVDVPDANDPVFQANTETFIAPDFKFGAYYFTRKFYVGFALPNLLNNQVIYDNGYGAKTEFDVNNLHYHLHGGYEFVLSENTDLNVSTLIKQVSGAPMQIDLNAQVVFNKKFGIGASYRTAKVINGLVNFRFTDYLMLGYAYDYNFNELSKVSTGTHEILLVYNLIRDMQSARIDGPRF